MTITVKAKSKNKQKYKPVMLILTFLESSSSALIPDIEKSIWLKLTAENRGASEGNIDITIEETDWEYYIYEENSYDFEEQWERKNTCYSPEVVEKMFPAYKIEGIFSGAIGSISNIEIKVESNNPGKEDVWEDREIIVTTEENTYLYKNFEWGF